jgi:hypothetical protein
MFPNVPSMWPGLPMPPRLRPKCKDCGTPTELLFLFEGGVCEACRFKAEKRKRKGYWPIADAEIEPWATATTTGAGTWPATGTGTGYYYSTDVTTTASGHIGAYEE